MRPSKLSLNFCGIHSYERVGTVCSLAKYSLQNNGKFVILPLAKTSRRPKKAFCKINEGTFRNTPTAHLTRQSVYQVYAQDESARSLVDARVPEENLGTTIYDNLRKQPQMRVLLLLLLSSH